MRHGRKILIASLLVAGFAFGNQRITPTGSFVLNLDYAKFRNDQKSAYLEVYYAFYPRLVTLEKSQDSFVGGIHLWTKLKNKQTGEFVINERSLLRLPVADTADASFRSTLISQAGYALPFGEYTLEVMAQDSLSPSRRDSILLPVTLREYPATVVSSDLELCSKISNSEKKNDSFYKNSLEVLPNPTLVFGVMSHPVIFNYSEVYNLNPQETYSITTQVVAANGKIVRESSRQRKYGVKNAVEVGVTNVTSIASGRYRFRLLLADEKGNAITNAEKTFFIYNPHIQAETPSVAAVSASELAGLSNDELAEEFREAQYIATDQEIKMFNQIEAAGGRREFLAKFWNEVAGGRRDKAPITRGQYLQRVASANKRYRAFSREGWRTDRGRIFILYADPDEIERFPSSGESKPYEVWRYYGIENGVEFVFVDRSGFGDYILVHSTKRGELRDESWQRFLQ